MTEPHSPGTFARAFTSLSLASGVSMGANLIRGKLAALFLGPAGVGIFNQLSVMWNLFQTGGSLGAFSGLVQHGTEAMVSNDKAALYRLASTWWILLTAVSCSLVVVGAIAAGLISNWLLGDHGAHANLVALMLVSIPFAVTSQVYRALLGAARLVPDLVRAQILSDLGGAVVFAALVPVFGLRGAVIGFSSIHVIFYVVTALSVRKALGAPYARARLSEFRWAVVRSNMGFGAVGLTTIALSNLSVLVVSRLIIDGLGIESSGIFSNAWRIASVYLGAVTTTTISYYLPTVTRAEDDKQMGRHVDETVRFYIYVLPPIMAVIMIAGEQIVRLILSAKFVSAAPLLLLLVPAELMRVLAETINVPLLARRRLTMFILPYMLQAIVFIAVTAMTVSHLGLVGPAIAYAVGTTCAAIANLAACRSQFALRFERQTWIAFVYAIGVLAAVAIIGVRATSVKERLLLDAAALTTWGVWFFQHKSLRELLLNGLTSMRRSIK